jgi:hypothetical protein
MHPSTIQLCYVYGIAERKFLSNPNMYNSMQFHDSRVLSDIYYAQVFPKQQFCRSFLNIQTAEDNSEVILWTERNKCWFLRREENPEKTLEARERIHNKLNSHMISSSGISHRLATHACFPDRFNSIYNFN